MLLFFLHPLLLLLVIKMCSGIRLAFDLAVLNSAGLLTSFAGSCGGLDVYCRTLMAFDIFHQLMAN